MLWWAKDPLIPLVIYQLIHTVTYTVYTRWSADSNQQGQVYLEGYYYVNTRKTTVIKDFGFFSKLTKLLILLLNSLIILRRVHAPALADCTAYNEMMDIMLRRCKIPSYLEIMHLTTTQIFFPKVIMRLLSLALCRVYAHTTRHSSWARVRIDIDTTNS